MIIMNEFIDEYKLLKSIAYCALGMFQSENERNFGDAEEWKFRLKQEVDKYVEKDYDFRFLLKEDEVSDEYESPV